MKRYLAFIFLLLIPARADALGGKASQIFVNGTSGEIDLTNSFIGITGDRGISAGEVNRYCLAATAGTLRDLYIKGDVAPGAGNSWIATVFQNGVASALTTSISGASQTTNNDSTNELTIAAGDTLTIKFTKTGTPGITNMRTAVRFIPNNSSESFYCGGPSVGTLSTTATEFMSIQGLGGLNATEANVQVIVPIAGTVAALYVKLDTAPGGVASRDFTVMLNGVAQSMTCNVGSGATTCSTTANTFSVVAGDKLSVKSVPNSTPAAAKAKVSILLQATTNGEFFIGEPSDSNLTNSANTFNEVDSASNSANATEVNVDALALPMTIKNAYCFVQSSPGVGKQYVFNFRQNAASAGPSVTISGTNTSGNNSTTVVLAANDLIDWQIVPTGTPTATPGACSVAAFTTPRRIW